MTRPLCLMSAVFAAVVALLLYLYPLPFYEDIFQDGERVVITGEVYKIQNKNQKNIIYIKSIRQPKLPQKSTQGVICYLNNDESVTSTNISSVFHRIKIGSKVMLEGSYLSFDRASNPGQFDAKNYYRMEGIDFSMTGVEILKVSKEFDNFRQTIWEFRNKWVAVYEEALPEEEASILKAMVLGEKESLDTDIKDLYKRSGISHILAISGLHISLIGMTFYKLCRKIFAFIKKTYWVTTAGACFSVLVMGLYGIMTDASGSTLRAILMFAIYLGAKLAKRSYDLLTALAVSGVLLLAEQPLFLHHAGFQLSFGAVLGIGLVNPVLEAWLPFRNKLWKNFLAGFSVSFFTLPILLYHFFEFPIYSPLLNLLIIPLMSILLVFGIPGGLIGILLPAMGELLLLPCRGILFLYEGACNLIEKLPANLLVIGRPEGWQIAVFYGVVLCMIGVWGLLLRWKHVVYPVLLTVAIFMLTIRPRFDTQVVMVDIGQGDCIYIGDKEGKNILIDGGSSNIKEAGKYRLMPFLKAKGVRQVDYTFLTHPDADHYSCILECLEKSGESGIFFRYLVLSELARDDEDYDKIKQAANSAGTKVVYIKENAEVLLGESTLKCLYPSAQDEQEDANEGSLVLEFSCLNTKMLFTGDIGSVGEAEVIGNLASFYEILKVGHHGSNGSSSQRFLAAVLPEVALISCGEKNSYGHPHEETLERLEEVKAAVFQTPECGAITVRVSERGYRVLRYLKRD